MRPGRDSPKTSLRGAATRGLSVAGEDSGGPGQYGLAADAKAGAPDPPGKK